MSGTEGSADPAESGVDTTTDGLLPGSSNQVGLASYFTRPSTNPIQTREEIEEELEAVLDGVQDDNVSFPGGVDMDFAHEDAFDATNAAVIAANAEATMATVLDGNQIENTDFTTTTPEGVITGVNMDYNSSTFTMFETRGELRAVLKENITDNVDFGTINLNYERAPSLSTSGKSNNIANAAEGLLLAHAPNTASPGSTLGGAVNFDLAAAPLKPLEPGADLVPYPADPAATSAEIASRDYTTPGSRRRLPDT